MLYMKHFSTLCLDHNLSSMPSVVKHMTIFFQIASVLQLASLAGQILQYSPINLKF